MSYPLRATNEQILAAYNELGSVKEVGKRLGMCGQSVHERLVKLGAANHINVFTDEDRERLKRDYPVYGAIGRLGQLAKEMGRTLPFLSRQARELGLTDPKRPHPWGAIWKYMTPTTAEVIWEDFKSSRLGMNQYCEAKGFDDGGFARTMRDFFGDEWDHVIELKAPKSSMYRLGRALEYRSRDDLRKRGYFVTRSPGSRSPIDLVGIRLGRVVFVQAKRSGQLGPKEWNELFDLSLSVGAVPIMVRIAVGGRGLEYYRLLARKDGTNKRQPMEAMEP